MTAKPGLDFKLHAERLKYVGRIENYEFPSAPLMRCDWNHRDFNILQTLVATVEAMRAQLNIEGHALDNVMFYLHSDMSIVAQPVDLYDVVHLRLLGYTGVNMINIAASDELQ